MSQTSDVSPRYDAGTLWRWSDALASAGLFGLALLVFPDQHQYQAQPGAGEPSEGEPSEGEPSTGEAGAGEASTGEAVPELFRPAELAVLAADHAAALRLLKEYGSSWGDDALAEPAVVLLTAAARTQAGEPTGWPEVQDAAANLPGSPWADWLLALAGITVPQLDVAGPAAHRALDGGCRDPRLPVIAAAAIAANGDELTWEWCAEAVLLLEISREVQLPTEDVLGATLDLLRRAEKSDRASTLAAYAVSDLQVPLMARDAWRAAAKSHHIDVPRHGLVERWGRGRREAAAVREHRALELAVSRNLTCRCSGSTGWIGPDRLYYVDNHMTPVDDAPVAGLSARLLRCRYTGVRFLDLADQALTLPVDRAP